MHVASSIRKHRFFVLHILILCLCLFCYTACGTQGGNSKTTIIHRTASATVAPGATKDLEPACHSASYKEALIGGGYSIEKPAALDQPALVVEASYPEGGWHVTFFNPDTNPKDQPVAVTVVSNCLTSPIGISAGTALERGPNVVAPGIVKNQCRQGDTVLSGGFKFTDDPRNNTPSLPFGTAVTASKPHLNSSGQADGWLVSYDIAHTGSLPLAVYVLCSDTLLQPASVVHTNPTTAPTSTGIIEDQTPSCGTNQLSTGDGFQFNLTNGQHSDTSSLYDNEPNANFAAWQAKAQVPTGVTLQLWATCITING